jgi:hypothetical protein
LFGYEYITQNVSTGDVGDSLEFVTYKFRRKQRMDCSVSGGCIFGRYLKTGIVD